MQSCAKCGRSFTSAELTDVHEIIGGRAISNPMCDGCLSAYMRGKSGVGIGHGGVVQGYASPRSASRSSKGWWRRLFGG
jgi:hypothetical protein